MSEDYEIVKYLSAGLIRIFSLTYGAQFWALTNQMVRKNHNCSICGKTIYKGKDWAFRPVTNLGNRMERICLKCGTENT